MWQPIEMAPKVARDVEVRDAAGRIRVAHFAHCTDDGEQPSYGPAFFEKVCAEDGRVLFCSELHPQPIEWRPLPAPPPVVEP